MPPPSLSDDEQVRYARQLIMPEIGQSGQQRLKGATVLIAGLGGLGSVSAAYMAAAGVGRLRIADLDRVTLSNLNRQIIYHTADVGRLKTESARAKLTALNPCCRIEALATRIEGDSVETMVSGCDLILDGSDNIATRRVLNRAARREGIPFVFGAVSGFDGMAATFMPGGSACLECLFPDHRDRPPQEVGVVGPTVGLVASLQSMEAVKILTGKRPDLAGFMVHIHGQGMRVIKSAVDPNPDCRVCSRG
ncbi:MAG: HesA/MoeB/ThiF family protein [Desulfosarcina sp.]